MLRKIALQAGLIAIGALALSTSLLGCGDSGVSAEQFIGSWELELDEGAIPRTGRPTTITLRSDGRGAMNDPPNRQMIEIMWVLRGDKLVLTPLGMGYRLEFLYRFEDSGKMILTIEGEDFIYLPSEPPSD